MDVSLAHEVEQPARCRNEHINTFDERRFLGTLGHTAKNNRAAYRGKTGVRIEILTDLSGEFTCGAEDQSLYLPRPALVGWIFQQPLDDGDRKGSGLAGACLGTGKEILATQEDRNTLLLNGRGLSISFGAQCIPDGVCEV